MGEPAELSRRRSDKPTPTTAAAASLDALHGRVTDEIDRRPSRRARVDRSAAHARARCDADSARRRTSRPSRPASPADPKAISDALAQLVEWGNLRRSRYEPSDERRGLPPRAVPVPAHPRRRGRGSGELAVSVALTDTEIEPSAGHEIERRRLLRQQHRIVPGQHDHRRAKPQPRGAHGKASEQHQRG